MQTGSENLSNQLEEPDDYKQDSDDTVKQYLSKEVPDLDFDNGVKPNVVEIMSESFADFRAFSDKLAELGYTDLDSYYSGLDRAASMGTEGTLIVPTYASYTVRTEFELLFGLPVKSLNDPNMPQRMLLTRQQPLCRLTIRAGVIPRRMSIRSRAAFTAVSGSMDSSILTP